MPFFGILLIRKLLNHFLSSVPIESTGYWPHHVRRAPESRWKADTVGVRNAARCPGCQDQNPWLCGIFAIRRRCWHRRKIPGFQRTGGGEGLLNALPLPCSKVIHPADPGTSTLDSWAIGMRLVRIRIHVLDTEISSMLKGSALVMKFEVEILSCLPPLMLWSPQIYRHSCSETYHSFHNWMSSGAERKGGLLEKAKTPQERGVFDIR